MFNLRHASLQNVIEQIFGVIKKKYQILQSPTEYSINTQTRIILAYYTLHNFVQSIEGKYTDVWLDTESLGEEQSRDIQPIVDFPKGVISSKKMGQFRDEIAQKMWEDYQIYLGSEI